jgi:hypothetical protein
VGIDDLTPHEATFGNRFNFGLLIPISLLPSMSGLLKITKDNLKILKSLCFNEKNFELTTLESKCGTLEESEVSKAVAISISY